MRNTLVRSLCTWSSIFLTVACVLLSSAALAQSQAKIHFNLPSQPLADSLRAIAGQTNSNILFDRSLVRGLTAKPLRAELSVQEAIAELLKGTSLTFRNADDKTVLITAKEQDSVGEQT